MLSSVITTCILFLIPPRPPRSTLFPYTTLFRSANVPTKRRDRDKEKSVLLADSHSQVNQREDHEDECLRSEEHTSELQSRQYLVCRLLLEKKKNKILGERTIHLRILLSCV